jgi:hypothetical protein
MQVITMRLKDLEEVSCYSNAGYVMKHMMMVEVGTLKVGGDAVRR